MAVYSNKGKNIVEALKRLGGDEIETNNGDFKYDTELVRKAKEIAEVSIREESIKDDTLVFGITVMGAGNTGHSITDVLIPSYGVKDDDGGFELANVRRVQSAVDYNASPFYIEISGYYKGQKTTDVTVGGTIIYPPNQDKDNSFKGVDYDSVVTYTLLKITAIL